MPASIDGRICLVTGANSGIGYEISKGLASLGATLVIVARDRTKGEDARSRLQREADSDSIELELADLAVLAEVRALAERFRARHDQLHVLVNNAGVVLPRREVTPDGYERTFAVNHLAPFLLTTLLLDTLRSSAPARIVTVSSDAHRGGRMNFDDLQSQRAYSAFRVYATTKLCNILFTTELARRLAGTGVTANAVHPGFVANNLGRGNGGVLSAVMPTLQRLFAISSREGARTPLHVATSPEVEDVRGLYFAKSQPATPAAAAQDADAARRLWEASARLTGLPIG